MKSFLECVKACAPVKMMTRRAEGQYSTVVSMRVIRYDWTLLSDSSLESLTLYAQVNAHVIGSDGDIRSAYFGPELLSCRLETNGWRLTGDFLVANYYYAGQPIANDAKVDGGMEFTIELRSHGPLVESPLPAKP